MIQILRIIWVWFFFPLFLLGLDQYFYLIGLGPEPKMYYFLWIGTGMLLYLHNTNTQHVLHLPLMAWSAVYFIMAMLWMPLAWNAYVSKEFSNVAITVICIVTCCVVLSQITITQLRSILWFCIVLGAATVVYDMVNPGALIDVESNVSVIEENSTINILGRAAGVYQNPNNAGVALLSMAFALVLIEERGAATLAMCIAFIGIFLTFSRSAITAWLLATIMFVMTGRFSRNFGFIILSLLVVFVLVGQEIVEYAYHILERNEIDWTNSLDRVSFFLNGSLNDESSEARINAAQMAMDDILHLPFLGSGLGYSQHWTDINPEGVNTHNIYLKQALDFGAFGFLLFPSFIITALYFNEFIPKKDAIIIILVDFFLGFTSHNLMEQFYFLLPTCIMSRGTFYKDAFKEGEEK